MRKQRTNLPRHGKSQAMTVYLTCKPCGEEAYPGQTANHCGNCGNPFEKSKPTFRISKDAAEAMENEPWRMPKENLEAWLPPEEKMFGEPGAWIMVLRVPNFGPELKGLRAGQVFWARHDEGADEYGYRPDGQYLIVVENPWMEFKLYPHEYSVIAPEKVFEMVQAKELLFHAKKGVKVFNEQLFYCQSRGIALQDALPMVLGSVRQNVGWFEPAPAIAAAIAEMFDYNTGRPVLSQKNHDRRAAARKRMEAANG